MSAYGLNQRGCHKLKSELAVLVGMGTMADKLLAKIRGWFRQTRTGRGPFLSCQLLTLSIFTSERL